MGLLGVVDGSTFYCSDNSKLYVYCKDNWYERKPLGGGGGTTYTAGEGIDITEDDTISIDHEVVATLAELDERVAKGEGSPTTATEGVIGGLYEDNTNGKLYICTAITEGTDPNPDTYTWVEVGAGGGGGGAITTLTTDDYNYPVDNPLRISLALLPSGFYNLESNSVKVELGSTKQNMKDVLFYVSQVDFNDGVHILLYYPRADATTGNPYIMESYLGSPSSGAIYTSYTKHIGSVDYFEHFGGFPKTNTSAPTTATEGAVGQIFVDVTTQKGYLCTSASAGTYTWKEITLS